MDELQYVGFWARFWATMVDIVLLLMLIYPLFYLLYGSAFLERAGDFTLVNNVINFLVPFIAVMFLWKSKGATPGKMLIKATIVDEKTLQAPSTKQLFIRYWAYLLSALPLMLGYFWAGWDKKKQTWHDKLAHTVVIQPQKAYKKKSLGSYVAIGFGIFAIVVFTALMAIGFMIQSGVIPDGDLYTKEKLPQSVLADLRSKNILQSDENLTYYQSESLFSYVDSATLFTQKGISYFESDEQGEIILWYFPFKDIGKLLLKSEKIALGIELITMEIYNNEGEFEFSNVLTPRSGQAEAFIEDVQRTWKAIKR